MNTLIVLFILLFINILFNLYLFNLLLGLMQGANKSFKAISTKMKAIDALFFGMGRICAGIINKNSNEGQEQEERCTCSNCRPIGRA